SHITAYEAEHLLKREPDGAISNGPNVVKFQVRAFFPAPSPSNTDALAQEMHEFQSLHSTSGVKIDEFPVRPFGRGRMGAR
ncbi:hypothetical protein C8J57DRAFT_1066308, partial [Mycena rebaudengoi]